MIFAFIFWMFTFLLCSSCREIDSTTDIDNLSSSTARHVMVVHLQELTDDQGGDNHVFGQIKAFLRLGYNVTYVFLLDYKKHYDRKDFFDLHKLGVHVIDGSAGANDGTAVLNMKLQLAFQYDAVVEFLWGNPQYLAYLRQFNQILKDISPLTDIVIVNPDIFHQRLQKEYGNERRGCRQCTIYKEAELYFWENAEIVAGVSEEVNSVTRKLVPAAKVLLLPYCELVPKVERDLPWNERSGVIYAGQSLISVALLFIFNSV